MRTIGVIGGGQLCLMMARDIARKGLPFQVIALDSTPRCPAFPYLKEQIAGSFKDPSAIRELADRSDILTYEIELANAAVLESLEKDGKTVAPSAATLATIQDKLAQRRFLRAAGLPVPDFAEVRDAREILSAAGDFGYPSMLKARRDSYDGRGNMILRSESDVEPALSAFAGRELMLERFVHFDMEVSVIAARGQSGEIAAYPLVENIHRDHVLRATIAPGRVPEEVAAAARRLAMATLERLGGAGVFGIEMFVSGGQVSINEIAPRVHNSGHFTIEACEVSQFEQHVRAISGMPLGSTELNRPAVMFNLLGDPAFSGAYRIEIPDDPPPPLVAHLHDYGKHDSSPGRKLGHVTYTSGDADMTPGALYELASAFHDRVAIMPAHPSEESI